jgi:AmmeMemoRadiSam system protein A
MPLTPAERRLVLDYARRAVDHAVRHGSPEPRPPADGPFAGTGGLFLTLKVRRDGALRGCIGHLFSGRPLGETLAEVARASALEDPRFPPVRPEECAGLAIEISILGEFVETRDPQRDLRTGVHGLRIRLGGQGGLLLPQVAAEHGLDGPAFLEAVCRKAGLPSGAWRDPAARVELFTAEVFGE